MPIGDPVPVDNTAQLYQIQTDLRALRETVERQGRTIDALIASIPQMSQPSPQAVGGGRSASAGKVYREWAAWLQTNGPAYRQKLMEETGRPLPANQPVVEWRSIMDTWADEVMPLDTMCKINGPSDGKGRPPSIYFLWAQRFEIHGLFGVGPSERPEPTAVTGVIQPPTLAEAMQSDTVIKAREQAPNPQPVVETEEEDVRFATMEEWHARWDPVFDEVAPYDAVPTDEEKAAMRETLPEGENWVEVLAVAYQEARVRSQG